MARREIMQRLVESDADAQFPTEAPTIHRVWTRGPGIGDPYVVRQDAGRTETGWADPGRPLRTVAERARRPRRDDAQRVRARRAQCAQRRRRPAEPGSARRELDATGGVTRSRLTSSVTRQT